MKALTFAQAYAEKTEPELWQEMDSDEKLEVYESIEKYYKFISQGFKPEMIVELFERFDKIYENFYKHNYYNLSVGFGENNLYLSVDEVLVSTPKKPLTLNDFISDCQRAGIELRFKETVIIFK